MNMMRFIGAAALAPLLALMLVGCTTPPKSQPVVIDEPVDAFNAVGNPRTPHNGHSGGSLSGDVQRLQDARALYERSQDRQQNAVERSQQHCLEQSDSRRVPIQGASSDAVFCEPAVK